MKNLKLVSAIIMFLFLISCEDDNSSREPWRMSGYLYESCNKEPYANLTLTCTCRGGVSFTRNNETNQQGTFTTDANGYFNFTFNDCGDGYTFLAKDGNGLEAFTT